MKTQNYDYSITGKCKCRWKKYITNTQKSLYTTYFLTLGTTGYILCNIGVKQRRPDKEID